MRFTYKKHHLAFIRKHYKKMPLGDVAVLFNAKYGTNVTATAMRSAAKNHNIKCGRKPADRIYPYRGDYKEAKVAFLLENYKVYSLTELTNKFNEHFKIDKTKAQIRSAIHNRKITSGRNGQFGEGHESWNKGTKGICKGSSTSFKPGHEPANIKPLYSERICSKDGFILIKVPEKNPYTTATTRYKHKHVWLWEKKHGPVPKDHVVAFKDGNQLHCVDENLMLLNRSELLALNVLGYKDQPNELKPSILALAKLEAKARIRTRRDHLKKKRRRHGDMRCGSEK